MGMGNKVYAVFIVTMFMKHFVSIFKHIHAVFLVCINILMNG